MIHTLKSDYLTVQINEKGAQLWSIRTEDGTEYLWQGDPKYWEDRALNLFPQIGLCTNNTYTLHGREYKMDIHGFIKDTVLAPAECGDSRLVLACEDTEETRAIYPFRFRYAIAYTLEHQTLDITVTVDNRDSQTMYFSVGGHPGFNLPLEEGLAYDDYCLQFPAGATAKRAECTPGDCIMLDRITDYPLVHDRIPLSHELFAQRVLILTDMPRQVTLMSDKGHKQVTVTYPDMKYLGVWKCLGTQAPYVCIEPWTGVSARRGVVEAYESHPDMIHLAPGGHYENDWSIQIV